MAHLGAACPELHHTEGNFLEKQNEEPQGFSRAEHKNGLSNDTEGKNNKVHDHHQNKTWRDTS